MSHLLSLPTAVVLIASVIAAVTDVTRFKVYNLLTLPLMISGLVYHGVVEGPAGLVGSLLGLVLGASLLLVFCLMGGMGAGDVKLMGAVGAWLGLPNTFFLFLASALAAGLYAIVLILAFGSVHETWVNLQIVWRRVGLLMWYLGTDDRVETEVVQPDRRRRLIPFAAMIAVGLAALCVASWLKVI